MSGNAYQRLSDKILPALNLALEQKDLSIAELLNRALEQALTRGAGGKDFVERREFTAEVEKALETLEALRAASRR